MLFIFFKITYLFFNPNNFFNKTMKTTKDNFLKDQLWNAAWRAATQRANIYSGNINKDEFRKLIKQDVLNFIENHKDSLSEDELINKIETLSKQFSYKGVDFKIGHSQKLINLMLKYYWCLGWLKYIPPHCPIDRMILDSANVKIEGKLPSWTQLNSINEYKEMINQINNKIANKSLSEWELNKYQSLISKTK